VLLTKASAIQHRFNSIKTIQQEITTGFNDATMYPEDNVGTLFGAIVNKEQSNVIMHTRNNVLNKKPSKTKLLHHRKRNSTFIEKG